MSFGISHDRGEETMMAKARWFQTLTMEERFNLLCDTADFLMELNQKIIEYKDAEQSKKGIRILRLP